jgi:hypothetical protein
MQLDHHNCSLDDAEVRLDDCESTSDELDQDAPPPPDNDNSPAPLVGDEVMQPVPHFQAVDNPLHAAGAAWLEEQCQANGAEGCPVHILRLSYHAHASL